MYQSFRPGQEWLDTNGDRIEAHGGKIFYQEDTLFWYGENKEKTNGENGIWTYGIRAYASKDLYNWENLGLIIPPKLEDENSSLHPNQRLDRPHIIYNKKSKKYICWIKISGDRAGFIILTANNLLGPYQVIKDEYRPFGKKAGDFDLVVDEDTNEAYLYFDADHQHMISARLTDDYLDVQQEYEVSFDKLIPPFVREAPAHFKYGDQHYLLTSGLTGYVPNPSEVAWSTSYIGPFKTLGNLHPYDRSKSSYNSQISGVFKHPYKKNLYIALADRWVPDYKMNEEKYDILSRSIASRYDKRYQATKEEKMSLMDSPIVNVVNTSRSNYVWLPIEWENSQPIIRWYDEWSVEDFD